MKLAGNARVTGILQRMVALGRTPQALLFAGPEGIGKRSFAIELAKMLNCTHVSEPCGTCPACQKIDKGLFPDLKLVSTAKKVLPVDAIREITHFTTGRPFEGLRRVVIVNDAHKMQAPAQNALLKTLEEPSPHATIVLVSHHPHQLLPTILSRCMHLNFGPLDDSDLRSVLRDAGFDGTRIDTVVPVASGAVGKALRLLDDEQYDGLLALQQFVASFDGRNFCEIATAAEGIVAAGNEELFFDLLLRRFRDDCVRTAHGDDGLYRLGKALLRYEKTIRFRRFLRYNVTRSFLVESAVIALQN